MTDAALQKMHKRGCTLALNLYGQLVCKEAL